MKQNNKLVIYLILLITPSLTSCFGSKNISAPDPTGKRFPDVTATSLNDSKIMIPADLAGKPALLLIGYVQRAQFDADRWLYGALTSGLAKKAHVYEVPTIEGIAPRLMSNWIDSGMRSGIPKEDWGSVTTVYADAEKISQFTGNDGSRNIRAVLLDAKGRVLLMHDRGFSSGVLARMLELIKSQ